MNNKYELSPAAKEARREYYRNLRRKRCEENPEREREKNARTQQAYWEKKALELEAQQKEDTPNV